MTMPLPPTPFGQTTILRHGITLHCPGPRKFDPVRHWPFNTQDPPMPQEQSQPAPGASAPPHDFPRQHPPIFLGTIPFAPLEYVVHQHSTACLNCGRIHEWSIAYAHYKMRSRTGAAAIDNLSPIEGFSYNVPLRTVQLQERLTPICFECAPATTLQHLPAPPPRDAIMGSTLADAPPLKSTGFGGPRGPKKAHKPPKPLPTIDDLL